MAYIPPHKRKNSKDSERPAPSPESILPQFKRNLNPRSVGFPVEKRKDKHSLLQGGKIIYAIGAIHRWFPVGLADGTQFSFTTQLQKISLESTERKLGETPLALVLHNHLPKEDSNEAREKFLKTPWDYVADNVKQDLVSSFQNVKNEMECQKLVKPTLVARFGRILFHGSPSVNLDSVEKSSATETTIGKLKRSFYTDISPSYMDYIVNEAVSKVELDFEEQKELYHVKLSDNNRMDSTISCKCSLTKDYKKLELCKVELNKVRHLVADMSCLGMNLDLRLMLCTKRIISDLTDNEMHSIRSLISSAVLDPDVKGGLRWPLGKESSGDRYTVVGVWHTNAKAFRNSSFRLKVRNADRFDFRTSAGEATREVNLKMTGIVSKLLEDGVEINHVSEMLKDNLQSVWKHFLCDASST